MNENILLIAFGKKYVDILLRDYKKIPNNYNLIIYTDDVNVVKDKLKNSDVREYSKNLFRYFDKVLLSYKLSIEKKKSILYIDVGRLNEIPNKVWKLDLDNITNIHYMGSWQNLETAQDLVDYESEYFEKNYWDYILNYFKSDTDLKTIPTILERIFVFPYDKKMKAFIEVFENIRPLFEHTSLTKQNVYKGIGNGEGLAMGYSLVKSQNELVHIAQSNKIKKELI